MVVCGRVKVQDSFTVIYLLNRGQPPDQAGEVSRGRSRYGMALSGCRHLVGVSWSTPGAQQPNDSALFLRSKWEGKMAEADGILCSMSWPPTSGVEGRDN
jgi:hypothetical protein